MSNHLLSASALHNPRFNQAVVQAARPTTAAKPGSKTVKQVGSVRVNKAPIAAKPPANSRRFPRLANENTENAKSLSADYENLGSLWLDTLLETAAYLNAYLRAGLSTQAFVGGPGGSMPLGGFREGREDPEERFQDTKVDLRQTVALNIIPNLKINNDQITLGFKPTEFDFAFPVGRKFTGNMVIVEKVLRSIFPSFRMPTTYQKADDIDHIARYGLPAAGIETGWKNCKEFAKLRFTDQPEDGYFLPEGLPKDLLGDPEKKEVYACLFFNLKLTDLRTAGSHYGVQAMQQSGTVSSLEAATVVGNIEISVSMRFPLEFALYSTYARNMNEFVPKIFFDLIMQDILLFTVDGSPAAPARMMPLHRIRDENERTKVEWGWDPKPRTNTEGYAINTHGNVVWIPQVENPAEYDRILRESYDPKTGDIKPNDRIPELANRPLYTDWHNEAFVYTNAEGKMTAERLNGYVALDDITIAKYLVDQNRPFSLLYGGTDPSQKNYNPKQAENLNRLFRMGTEVAREQGILERIAGDRPIYQDLRRLYDYIVGALPNYGGVEFTSAEVLSLDIKPEDGTDPAPELIEAIQVFVKLNAAIAEAIPKSKKYAASTFMSIRFWFHLVGTYGAQQKRFRAAYVDGLKRNRLVETKDLPESVNLPNLPGLAERGLMPHQVCVAVQSDKEPDNMVLDIQPGGGKTICGIVDAIKLKVKGKAKLTMILCPTKLVKEWVSEINRTSRGKINAVPILADTVQKMVSHLGFDRKKFLEYVKTAPPNTIFIVGMSFLTLKRDIFDLSRKQMLTVQYGPMVLRRWPNSPLLRQMDPDYILIDESQFTKNETSLVTRAVKQIVAGAKIVRLASGTLIKNRTTDLPAQFGMMNPAILGDEKTFTDRYGVRDEWGNPTNQMDINAGAMIANDIAPYATRIVKRRADWGFMMPKIQSQFWRVTLTPRQEEHYQDILQKAVDKIRRNPKLVKLLQNSDPGVEAKIINALKKHLATVELFVNAPDYVSKDPAKHNPFPDMGDVNEDDLVSQKVIVARQIVRNHFEGGVMTVQTPQGPKKEEFKPDNAKIIIFCYNKLVSVHFVKHMRDMAAKYGILHYKAGTGSEDILLKFRQDPKYRVLIADETSLREGLNLQVASRIIRVQTLWAPGDQEQAMSRVMRPDVRQEYNRAMINYDWFVVQNTFEEAKVARIVAKMLENMRVSEADNPIFARLARTLPALDVVKMDLDSIQRKIAEKDFRVHEYVTAKLEDYEIEQFEVKGNELRQRIALKIGKPAADVTPADIRKHAMVPVISKTELPGSKPIFTALVNGAEPHDPRGLGLKPLAVLNVADDEDTEVKEDDADADDSDEDIDTDDDAGIADEDDADVVDNVAYDKGDVVQTEYGFGRIVSTPSATRKSVVVAIPGLPQVKITLSKQVVFKPTVVKNLDTGKTNEAAIAQLHKDFHLAERNGKGITFLNGNTGGAAAKVNRLDKPEQPASKTPSGGRVKVVMEPTGKKGNKAIMPDVAEPDKKTGVKIEAGIFNTWVAITVHGDPEETQHIGEAMPSVKWAHTPGFLYRHVRTWQAAKELVAALSENFKVSQPSLDAIMNVAKRLQRRGNPVLLQRTAQDLNIKNFIRMNFTKPLDTDGLHCYPLVMNGELYIAAAISTQPKAIGKLRKIRIPGLDTPYVHPPMLSALFRTPQQAMKVIQDMREHFDVAGVNTALKELKKPTIQQLLKK